MPAGTKSLSPAEIRQLLGQLPEWEFRRGMIRKAFQFDDFHRTMAFVNAVAWIAHVEDHHPDLRVTFGRCTVAFATHSIDGISMNDFVCAAKIEALPPTMPTAR